MGGNLSVGNDRRSLQSQGTPSREPILVGLIEDHRLWRERLADLLERQPGLHVAVSAAATPGGLERLQKAAPQVVVIGSAANGTAHHECLRRVREELPEARVVVMNVSADGADVILLIEEGASGLLLRDATVSDFIRTIRMVSGGTNVVPDRLVPLLFHHLTDLEPGSRAAGDGDTADPMTGREREVGVLIAGGLTNQGIADHLEISVHTVKTHVNHILRKLGLQSRLQIAVHFNRVAASSAQPTREGSGRGITGSRDAASRHLSRPSSRSAAARHATAP